MGLNEEDEEEVEDEAKKEEKEDDLSLTLIEAVRPPKKGELEQLICSELALAIMSTDPLQKIRHVLEAYRLLPPEISEEFFNKEERDEFRRLYEVCISFIEAYEEPSGNPYDPARWLVIPWSFSWMVGDQYLWWVTREWDLPFSNWREFKRELDGLDPERRRSEYLKVLCQALCKAPMALARQVQSEFVAYAMPVISMIMRRIFTGVVSAETWSETLSLMRGGGRSTR